MQAVGNNGQEYDPMAYYLWMRVAEKVEKQITSGELPTNAALPNERRMAEDMGVSLGTVRRAVQELRERGLVVTVPNKGTYVVPQERRVSKEKEKS